MPKRESLQRRNKCKSSRKLQLQHCRAMKKKNTSPLDEIQAPLVLDTPTVQPVDKIQPKYSASKRKLNYCSGDFPAAMQVPSKLPKCFVDLDVFKHLFDELLCPHCHEPVLRLEIDKEKSRGLALGFLVKCNSNSCNTFVSRVMSSGKLDSNAYDVNRRFVGGMLNAGLGHGGAQKFCDFMGVQGISHNSFNEHTAEIYNFSQVFSNQQLEKAVQKVREVHGASDAQVLDIAVSFDGSWQKRGHTSKHGIGAVIEQETGLVIDYHVLSSYCQTCATTGKEIQSTAPESYNTWWETHQLDCCKNHSGSAGAMEVVAAKVLWGRSLTKNLRYTSLISDGDCKTLSELNKLSPYGDMEIIKEECVNHVSKRLGTALRNLVADEKKRGVTLGGSKCGSLTQTKIALLQRYYKNAVLSKNNTVEELRDKIWASYFHSTSTDTDPNHHLCPQGEDSWCFYNKAVAKGEVLTIKNDSKSFLNQNVAKYVHSVYVRLTEDKLLSRCLKGMTQNANESFHSVVWARCPKHIFVGKRRIAVATALADFNRGSNGIMDFVESIGCSWTSEMHDRGVRRDQKRIHKAEKSEEVEVKRRRAKRTFDNITKEQNYTNVEGHLYLPGAAD